MGTAAPLDDSQSFMEWVVARAGSQAELARRTGLGTDAISDYVRGVHDPQLTNVLRMLRAVEVKIEGMPDRPDLAEETVVLLRDLRAYLDGDSRPPSAPEGA